MKKKVTIIMATFNRAHFILETISSIQNQTYLDWECIIIDDGGTDNTKEVISSVLEQDSRFKYVQRPIKYIKGLPGCRNYGLDLAKGDYVIFFDDDDIIHPDNLKININVIETNNIDFCHYQKKSFEKQKPIIKSNPISILQSLSKSDIKKIVTQEIGLASCTVFWKKKCFNTIRFNESLLYAEEWECYSRIIAENFKGIIISNILYYNRKHPNSNTGEFYRNNPVRIESKQKAILLVIKNLKEKGLLNYSIIRYFVAISHGYSENNLFDQLIKIIEFNKFDSFKWHFFYFVLPLRMKITRFKKAIINYKK